MSRFLSILFLVVVVVSAAPAQKIVPMPKKTPAPVWLEPVVVNNNAPIDPTHFASEIENFRIALPAANARAQRTHADQAGDAPSEATVVSWSGTEIMYTVTHTRFYGVSLSEERQRLEFFKSIMKTYQSLPGMRGVSRTDMKIAGMNGVEMVFVDEEGLHTLVRVAAEGKELFQLTALVNRTGVTDGPEQARKVFDTFNVLTPIRPEPVVKASRYPKDQREWEQEKPAAGSSTITIVKREVPANISDTISDADIFENLDLGLSIRLPRDKATPAGPPGAFNWNYPYAGFQAGVYKHPVPFDETLRKMALADGKASVQQSGVVRNISEKEITLSGYPGREMIVDKDGSRLIDRKIGRAHV